MTLLEYDVRWLEVRVMVSEGPWRVNAPHVIAESVDGEVLIVNLLSGAYYSSDGLGDVAWAMIAKGETLPAVASAIAAHYGIELAAVRADLEPWLEQLIADELVVEGEGPALDDFPEPAFPAAYAPPQVSKYTDMEDLLLLDPVHEVDQVGWPVAGATS